MGRKTTAWLALEEHEKKWAPPKVNDVIQLADGKFWRIEHVGSYDEQNDRYAVVVAEIRVVYKSEQAIIDPEPRED